MPNPMLPVTGSRPVPDPTELTTQALLAAIGSLRELLENRMDGADNLASERFAGRDLALAAALSAAKEAVAKSETFTAKQIEAIAIRIEDLKERLDRGDGRSVGQIAQSAIGDKAANLVFAIIGAITGLAGLIVALTVLFKH